MAVIVPSPSYMTYTWRPSCSQALHSNATLLESQTTIESGTTGLKTWPASLALAEYLIANPDIVRHKHVMELGCGAGLLGIITASLQEHISFENSSLYLTDVRDDVLKRCNDNVRLTCNNSSKHPRLFCRTLDWIDSLESPATLTPLLDEISVDVVLGADVVYDPSIIRPLVATLSLILAKKTSLALVSLTIRNPETLTQFLQTARK
ncbi:nicotinamide N-methyltransferase-like protein [Abortiporus biennis]|nr:nicotinamide N-methyltransferase-like protein [Abortiporus biennis]